MSPIAVLASPATSGTDGNPYIDELYGRLRTDHAFTVDHFSRKRMVSGRWNVAHVHWPEFLVSRRSRLRLVLTAAVTLTALAVGRMRGTRLVWNAHNVSPNTDRPDRFLDLYVRLFVALTDGIICLSEASAQAVRSRYDTDTPMTIARHGHYRDSFEPTGFTGADVATTSGVSSTRRVVLAFGIIRKYKRLDELVSAFQRAEPDDEQLVVVGNPRDVELGEQLAGSSDGERIVVRLGRVAHEDVSGWMKAADVAVQLYDIPNSGASMLALSHGVPVVVPDSAANRELADLVGSEWVHLHDGTADNAIKVASFVAHQNRHGAPDLSEFAWERCASQCATALRSAASPSPRSGGKVAVIGGRGVPATYGGVERHVEEIGSRLAAGPWNVTVYARPNYVESRQSSYRGMRVRVVPTIGTKHLDAIVHSLFSTLRAIVSRPDIVHYHALGPGLAAPLVRLFSKARVIQTIHGLDDQRAKWNPLAQAVLRFARWLSERVPHQVIVVSKGLDQSYRHAKNDVAYVSNGTSAGVAASDDSVLDRMALRTTPYVLFVGRLVPEKAPDLLIEAFASVPGDVRLVVAGDSSFSSTYAQEIRDQAAADSRVTFAGYVYGDDLKTLYAHAAVFVLPSHLEGMPLTLLEAIGYGTPTIASDIEPHAEVLGRGEPGGRLFRRGEVAELERALVVALGNGESEQNGAEAVRTRVVSAYSWEKTASATAAIYDRLLHESGG